MTWRLCYLLSLVAAGGTVSAGCDDSSLLDTPSESASSTLSTELGQCETPPAYGSCLSACERLKVCGADQPADLLLPISKSELAPWFSAQDSDTSLACEAVCAISALHPDVRELEERVGCIEAAGPACCTVATCVAMEHGASAPVPTTAASAPVISGEPCPSPGEIREEAGRASCVFSGLDVTPFEPEGDYCEVVDQGYVGFSYWIDDAPHGWTCPQGFATSDNGFGLGFCVVSFQLEQDAVDLMPECDIAMGFVGYSWSLAAAPEPETRVEATPARGIFEAPEEAQAPEPVEETSATPAPEPAPTPAPAHAAEEEVTVVVAPAPVDADLDGVPDTQDNCPELHNPDQLDQDDDGLGDLCDEDVDGDGLAQNQDNCPQTANESQSDLDQDGQGDACDEDLDNDGVVNSVDNCPEVANLDQADQDQDDTGDACDQDLDGDGVLNVSDNCPLLSNSDQQDSDGDAQGDPCDETPLPEPPNPVEALWGPGMTLEDACEVACAELDGCGELVAMGGAVESCMSECDQAFELQPQETINVIHCAVHVADSCEESVACGLLPSKPVFPDAVMPTSGACIEACDHFQECAVVGPGQVTSYQSCVGACVLGMEMGEVSFDQGPGGSQTLGCVLAAGSDCQVSTQCMEDFGSADEPVCLGDGCILHYFTGAPTD